MTERVPKLTVYCAARYGKIISEVDLAMRACGANSTHRRARPGLVAVVAYWKHWPCLFPQCGPGRKHERPIVLVNWQREIVMTHAGQFVRGLIHSDGYRGLNRVSVKGKQYAYPRYMFTNKSADIMALCQWGLDLLGVAWRMARPDSLSVAHRDAVAILDQWVGPKR